MNCVDPQSAKRPASLIFASLHARSDFSLGGGHIEHRAWRRLL